MRRQKSRIFGSRMRVKAAITAAHSLLDGSWAGSAGGAGEGADRDVQGGRDLAQQPGPRGRGLRVLCRKEAARVSHGVVRPLDRFVRNPRDPGPTARGAALRQHSIRRRCLQPASRGQVLKLFADIGGPVSSDENLHILIGFRADQHKSRLPGAGGSSSHAWRGCRASA